MSAKVRKFVKFDLDIAAAGSLKIVSKDLPALIRFETELIK